MQAKFIMKAIFILIPTAYYKPVLIFLLLLTRLRPEFLRNP